MRYLIYLLIATAVLACKEKYIPPFSAPAAGYLVVEGNINSGNGPTTISLSRTGTTTANTRIMEKKAIVWVEGSDNSSYPLQEKDSGRYEAPQLLLNSTVQYRVHIKTTDGKEYLSDYEALKTTPPIDSLSWRIENGGLQIYVNAHDDLGNTRYYLWDYGETWEIHATFVAQLKYVVRSGPRGDIVSIGYRDSTTFGYDRSLFTCWQSGISTALLIGSTAKLSRDQVYLPIAYIPPASRKLSELYSILVKQTALTKPAYEYLEKMKKNTEGSGTVFDPQPSELKGNIHCVGNPDELVVGYITASTYQDKRLFIDDLEVMPWGYRSGCRTEVVMNHPDSLGKAMSGGFYPSDIAESTPFGIVSVNMASSLACVDCTVDGPNKKPSFWP